VLLLFVAVALALGCVVASLSAHGTCKFIQTTPIAEDDPLEQDLLEREHNMKLSLAVRSIQVYGRVALAGGFALGFVSLISFLSGSGTGSGRGYDIRTIQIFAFGGVGWLVCRELHRRVGLLADSWRKDVNARRRRQGVDQIGGLG
jgi:hypothetical protein